MKIVVLDGYMENPGDLSWDGFEQLGVFTVYDRTPHDETVVIERIGDAEAVITNKVPLTGAIINACPSIRYIGLLATGYNVVDVDAARARNIPVCNVPAYGTAAVGQFAIALLLEIACRVGYHSRAVAEGRWTGNIDFCFWDYPLIELMDKTMGIVGFGQIGRATGRIAAALGMKVIAYDPYANDTGGASPAGEYVSFETLLACSDVISLHCPLFPETSGLINKDTIAAMKNGVIIINTARGPLIVEQDLADALNAGKVYAAGVDVVSEEPIRGDNPLLTAKNCFITPHIAWASRESRSRLMDIAVNNLQSFMKGKPVNVVN